MTSATQPRVERPQVPEGYGAPDTDEGLLPWEWAEQKLTEAPNYWFATVRPNGRPHASPIWGIWMDGALYFDGSPETRRMKNIAANPNVAVHLESGDEVVIIEGAAGAVAAPPDKALAERLSAAYTAKYKKHSYAPEPNQWDEGGLYRMEPRIGLGWTVREGEEFGKTYTRWRFD